MNHILALRDIIYIIVTTSSGDEDKVVTGKVI